MAARSVFPSIFLAVVVAAFCGGARAQENGGVVADISQHVVAISSGFRGTNLLLFGATDPDTDVVVVVEGPTGPASVRRKGRVAGVWMNTDEVLFEEIPSFYAVLSNRPLSDFTTPALRLVQEIGFDSLPLHPKREAARNRGDLHTFQEALIRAKMRRGLYQSEETAVEIISRPIVSNRCPCSGQCAGRILLGSGFSVARRQHRQRPDLGFGSGQSGVHGP